MQNMGLLGVGVLLSVVGLPVASYFMVFSPTNKEITRAKEEVAHMESLLAKLQEEAAKKTDFERANQQLEEGIKIIEERLPSNQEVDSVVRQVSNLAVESGLEPPTIKSNRAVPAGLYMEQPLEMQTTGSFVGFHTFLTRLEKLPRVTRIHDFELQGTPVSGQELEASFTLSIYFQDEEEESSARRGG